MKLFQRVMGNTIDEKKMSFSGMSQNSDLDGKDAVSLPSPSLSSISHGLPTVGHTTNHNLPTDFNMRQEVF